MLGAGGAIKKLVTLAVATALALTSCGAGEPEDRTPVGPPLSTSEAPRAPAVATVQDAALTELVAGNTELALDLFSALAPEDQNLLLAPESISEGLALPFLGARGTTADEMADALRFTLEGDELHNAMATLRSEILERENDQLRIAVANRAFGQEGFGFLDEYLAGLSRWYEAPLATVNFGDADAARQEINDWTSDQTEGRIPELFPPDTISAASRLVLVNAIYLKADWFFPFNPELTEPEPFTLLDGSTIDVDTMQFNEFLPSGSGEAWTAVQIPYAGEALSMIVVVPKNLEKFRDNFDAKRVRRIRRSIEDGGIHLHLPKFELSYHTSLVDRLKALGMTSAFGLGADFSGMTGSAALFIAAIEHETYVKVDEQGTEAAGATGTDMPLSHGPTVLVDKPFIFWIQDDATGAILFLGQVTDPRG